MDLYLELPENATIEGESKKYAVKVGWTKGKNFGTNVILLRITRNGVNMAVEFPKENTTIIIKDSTLEGQELLEKILKDFYKIEIVGLEILEEKVENLIYFGGDI